MNFLTEDRTISNFVNSFSPLDHDKFLGFFLKDLAKDVVRFERDEIDFAILFHMATPGGVNRMNCLALDV